MLVNERRNGGGKKRKHPSADGSGEEKKRKRGEEKHKGQGEGEKIRLDALSVGYFRRVGERLSEEFQDNEEREMFVENVLSEVKGKASLVAMDRTGSITLQRLLPLATFEQVGGVLAELGGESGSGFKVVSCDRCGGHVVESALRQMSRWSEASQEDPSATTEEEEEEAEVGLLETQVLCLSQVIRDNSSEFIRHVHGSHVVRTLMHVLGGCLGPPRTEARPGGKERRTAPQLTDFEIPTSFWYELKSLTEALMENIQLSVRDAVASAVFQTMLTVCHRKRPKLCKQLLKRITEYLTGHSAAPGVSPLLVFLKDQASSHLIETMIQFSHKSLLRDLYKHHLKGNLVDLALHAIANFPIQRLTAASAKHKHFIRLFDELVQGVEAILASGHMGVIVQLAESCAESGERQDEMMQCLLQAFHCAEPGSRHVSCLPLFMSLLTYEVYYQSEAAEGSTQKEVPLTSICYHGSRLVQALAKFKERSLLLSSLRTMSPADLLTLASDPAGSHVLQALITTSSDKGKGKILKRLEGQYVQMASSRLGSRVLEAVWNSCTVSQRKSIAQELAPCETQLRADQFARHVWAKFALSHFVQRRAHWQEIQTGESRKRKMFSDILE
ncbi:nucleolar protein 9 [Nothobranchius furzeri]|uniref:NOP9 nucleolar protein n=1 Tax=Nothobranchius furzeri TaxID=105023 RepID=A0A1A8B9G0_NOTFU|nr:nucleolar protein 9 [Nothobranchius furzeri]XP_015812840.1 nucleolar protein 9 [Nothobranchius furzeri]XP_054589784.1 nucleolar protein 9 [Nothobranchius furzeri]KAF7222904.1 transcript variant X1 [Nothobranchius furzeri]KAF7222905.1 transcript variant X2 [Nothobranchius furzeri]